MKLIFTTLLLVCLVLGSSFFEAASIISPAPQPVSAGNFCPRKCNYRCSKASAQDRCLKYCNICCKKCHCVPSGTYGHKDECPCYRDLKNSKGKGKCP